MSSLSLTLAFHQLPAAAPSLPMEYMSYKNSKHEKMHGPRVKCTPCSVSSLVWPSKEAGTSAALFADERNPTLGEEGVIACLVRESRCHCKDLSPAFQVLFFPLVQ